MYTAGAILQMTLNYNGNVLSLYAPLWANMTSSTKPEVHNVLHCHSLANFAKFGHVIFEIRKWTDKPTDSDAAHRKTSHP